MKELNAILLIFILTQTTVAKDYVTVTIEGARDDLVNVTFTNNTDEIREILRPLDGSTIGSFQPHYNFTVKDRSGKEPRVVLDCIPYGLWANLDWPDDYIIRLMPGDSETLQLNVPQLREAKGTLQVTFQYEYDSKDTHAFEGVPYPSSLWEGTINSPAITIKR